MIHVVVIPLPVHGHTNPMLQMSLKLVWLGSIKVSFVTTRKSLQKFQEEFHHENLEFLTISDGEEDNPAGGGEQGIWNNFLLLQRTSGEIEQLIQQSSHKHGPVSYFIFDLITVGALISIWSKTEVPKFLFWTSSATFLLLSVHLRLLVAEGYLPLKTDHPKDAVLNDSVVPGITELNLHKDVPYSFQKAPDEDPNFQGMSSVREIALEASSVFINTFQELEDDAIRALLNVGVKVQVVGPLLPAENNQVKDPEKGFTKVFSWLSARPVSSVIYVSFGTMASLNSRNQVEELAYGLENSGHFFLWVLAKESALLLPEDFVSRIAVNQQGLICSWCPQLGVLQHSSVGGFLSHCGWNSVMESIYCGVGMIGWPCLAEQNLNIKYVEDVWGTGRRITTPDLDGGVVLKETIETEVKKLMGAEGVEVRERAARLSGAARRAGWSIKLQEFLKS